MDFPLPQLGEGVYEAEMIRWCVKEGDTVKRGQVLLEVMTDKASMEVPAPFAGVIAELKATPGSKIKVGEVILAYQPAGAIEVESAPALPRGGSLIEPPSQTPPVAPALNSNGNPTVTAAGSVAASAAGNVPVAAPSVRYLARKLGVDLRLIRGSGPGGRILLDDLSAAVRTQTNDKPAKPAKDNVPQFDLGSAGSRVRFVGLRRKIAQHLVDSKRRIPHYSYIDECDITEIVRLRQSLREPCAERGVKLTYLAFFVKAVAGALKDVPIVNSTLDEQAEEIVFHDRYNVGIAVAAPSGLIVPVIHDADRKDLLTIAGEIDRLGREAKAGRVKLEDLRGGTFTITSVGNIGGVISTPIINHPEVGIMGLGKVIKRPVYDAEGNIVPAEMIYLSFSFDHRVVDGAVGAVFGNAVVKRLQSPAAMLLPELTR